MKHPQCFPYAVSYQIGGISLLIEKYEFFHINNRIQEVIIPLPIGVDPKKDEDTLLVYLNYLQTGKINLDYNHGNVLHLNAEKIYRFAKQQNDLPLKDHCLNHIKNLYLTSQESQDQFYIQYCEKFFIKLIDFDILIDILEFALIYDLKDLMWISLIFAFNNYEHEYLHDIIQNEWFSDMEFSAPGKSILVLGQSCLYNGITPYFKKIDDYPSSPNTYERGLKIGVVAKENMSSQQNLLGSIYNFFSIDRLDFQEHEDKEIFELLMTPFWENLLPLNCLLYKQNYFDDVNLDLLASPKTLILSLSGPEVLKLPRVENLILDWSRTIKSIECIHVKELKCVNCYALETLYAPNVEKADLKNLENLKSLTVKRGCDIKGEHYLPKNCIIKYV